MLHPLLGSVLTFCQTQCKENVINASVFCMPSNRFFSLKHNLYMMLPLLLAVRWKLNELALSFWFIFLSTKGYMKSEEIHGFCWWFCKLVPSIFGQHDTPTPWSQAEASSDNFVAQHSLFILCLENASSSEELLPVTIPCFPKNKT